MYMLHVIVTTSCLLVKNHRDSKAFSLAGWVWGCVGGGGWHITRAEPIPLFGYPLPFGKTMLQNAFERRKVNLVHVPL